MNVETIQRAKNHFAGTILRRNLQASGLQAMTKPTSRAALRSVLGLLEVQSLRSTTDQELLRRFVASKDESAFRVVAERHGPMVLGVCRRVLLCPHDAEDAFQATFLVFSKRAASIRKSASLGSWLHGVAMRVALKLRRDQARRRRREQFDRHIAAVTSVEQLTWTEVKTGLDEELLRLPEHYRTVLVLCYLEGQTRDEAALQLGLTLSALHGRLERGRKLLAARLSKRGLTLSAAIFPLALCPGDLLAIARAAALCTEQQAIAPSVLSLTNEALKGTIMTKTKWATAALICTALLGVGVSYTTAQAPADKDKKPVDSRTPITSKLIPPKPTDDRDNLKNTLLALDKQMWEAGAKGDWQERQKFMADDMVSVSILGKYGKADAALADQRLRNKDGVIHDPVVVRVSADVAILTYRYDCKIVSNDGNLLETCKDYRVVYTWAYRDGGWVIVFCHDDHGRLPKPERISVGSPLGLLEAEYINLFNRSGKQTRSDDQVGDKKNAASGTSALDLDLLKTKVELAMLTVKEKQLILDAAVEKKTDRNQVELLRIELDRARLLLKEAELNLAVATKKSQSPAFSNTVK